MNYPFNVRSFFTDRETKDIGSGIQLWRGYFQSVRPGIGQMFINIDISTATMYKSGPLISLCLDYMKPAKAVSPGPPMLYRQNLPERDLLRLQRFVSGIRVITEGQTGPAGRPPVPRVIKKLTRLSAKEDIFTMREGGKMSVADYFRQTMNKPLRFPDMICVEVYLLSFSLKCSILIHCHCIGWIRRKNSSGTMHCTSGTNHEEANSL